MTSNCPYRYKSPRTRKAKTFSRKQLLKFLGFYPSSLYLPRIFKLLFYLRSIWNKHRQLNVHCRTVLKNWFLCFQTDMHSKVCFKNLPEFSSYKTLNPRTLVAQDVMLSVLPFWVAGFFTCLFFSGGRKGSRIRERRQYKQKKKTLDCYVASKKPYHNLREEEAVNDFSDNMKSTSMNRQHQWMQRV